MSTRDTHSENFATANSYDISDRASDYTEEVAEGDEAEGPGALIPIGAYIDKGYDPQYVRYYSPGPCKVCGNEIPGGYGATFVVSPEASPEASALCSWICVDNLEKAGPGPDKLRAIEAERLALRERRTALQAEGMRIYEAIRALDREIDKTFDAWDEAYREITAARKNLAGVNCSPPASAGS